jgi:DNA primase
LPGQPFEELAQRVMATPQAPSNMQDAPAPDEMESGAELRQLLNRMLVEQLKALETQAIEDSRTDPRALERYRELQARRTALEAAT